MPSKNVDLIQSLYDAFAAGDAETVVNLMSPDIVWMEAEGNPYADGNPYIGPDAVVSGVLARCATEWDGFSVNVFELLDAGDTVVALARYGGAHKATGLEHNTQVAHVWRIRDARILRPEGAQECSHGRSGVADGDDASPWIVAKRKSRPDRGGGTRRTFDPAPGDMLSRAAQVSMRTRRGRTKEHADAEAAKACYLRSLFLRLPLRSIPPPSAPQR